MRGLSKTRSDHGLRAWLAAASCTILMFSLAAGGSLAAKALDVWYVDAEWTFPAVLNDLLDQYELEHGVKTDRSGMALADMNAKLPVAIAGGSAPDVVFLDSSAALDWAPGRVFAPLGSILSELKGDIIPGKLREATFAGEIYALPLDFDLRGLFWNVELFEASGLDGSRGPTALAEMDQYAIKLARMDDGNIVTLGFYPAMNNWGTIGWIWTFGSDVFDWGTGEPTLDTAATRAVLDWMHEYSQRWPWGPVSQLRLAYGADPFLRKAFVNGRVAMTAQVSSFTSQVRVQAADMRFGTGRVPHPPGGHNGTWTGGQSIAVPRTTKDVVAAGNLLRFFAHLNTQRLWGSRTGRFPANLRALQATHYDDPLIASFVDQAAEVNALPPYFNQIHTTLNKARERVMRMQSTPREALVQAQIDVRSKMESDGFFKVWGN